MAKVVDNQTNPKSNFTQLVLQDHTTKLIFMFTLDFFSLSQLSLPFMWDLDSQPCEETGFYKHRTG